MGPSPVLLKRFEVGRWALRGLDSCLSSGPLQFLSACFSAGFFLSFSHSSFSLSHPIYTSPRRFAVFLSFSTDGPEPQKAPKTWYYSNLMFTLLAATLLQCHSADLIRSCAGSKQCGGNNKCNQTSSNLLPSTYIIFTCFTLMNLRRKVV
ncbi:uncharacterized [Lates japonicus]